MLTVGNLRGSLEKKLTAEVFLGNILNERRNAKNHNNHVNWVHNGCQALFEEVVKFRNDFKHSVKIELIKRDWMQKDLAEKLGISEAYLSMVVNGSRNNDEIKERIKEVLGLGGKH